MPVTAIYVLVDDKHLDQISAVAHKLRQAGMNVEKEMPSLGAITGVADETHLAALKSITGVRSVSHGRNVIASS